MGEGPGPRTHRPRHAARILRRPHARHDHERYGAHPGLDPEMIEGACRNDDRSEAIRSAEACRKPDPDLVCGESGVLRGEAPAAAGGPWSRFALRAACVYTGNRARCESLHKELDRVGLDVQDFWAFPNPYDQVLMAAVPNACRAMRTVRSFFNSTMNHYRIVKTARALGYESILIVEDDARFLKDLRRVEEIV